MIFLRFKLRRLAEKWWRGGYAEDGSLSESEFGPAPAVNMAAGARVGTVVDAADSADVEGGVDAGREKQDEARRAAAAGQFFTDKASLSTAVVKEMLVPLESLIGENLTPPAIAAALMAIGKGGRDSLYFPEGVADFVAAFFELLERSTQPCGEQDAEAVEGDDTSSGKGGVTAAVTAQLERRLDLLFAYPRVAKAGYRWVFRRGSGGHFWQVADRIWWRIGDRSVDHNYYSKRLLLAAVYASTMWSFCYSGDRQLFSQRRSMSARRDDSHPISVEIEELKALCRRRLKQVSRIGKIKQQLKKWR